MARLSLPAAAATGSFLTAASADALGYTKWNATDSLLTANGVTVSDTFSVTNITDLPSAATNSGRTYIVTATPSAWYSDGAAWYQIGGNAPMLTWANFPAASAVAFGTTIRINPSSFGGTYKSSMGILMVSDTVNWKPYGGRQQMARGASTFASPLATVTGTGADALFNIATNFSMPAGLLSYVGIGVSVKAVMIKTGVDALVTTFRVKMGKNNTAGTTDIIYSGDTTAAAGQGVKIDQTSRVTVIDLTASAIDTFTTDTLQPNSRGTNLVNDKNTYLDTSVVNYVVFTANGTLTAATHGLVSFEIELVA